MTIETLIQLLLIVNAAIAAYLGYRGVKDRNKGNAIQSTAESVVKLSTRVDELEQEKSKLYDQIESTRKEHADELAKLEKQFAELETRFDQLQDTSNTQRDQIVVLTELLDKAEREAHLKDETITQLRIEVDHSKNEIAQLTTRLDDATRRLNAALVQLAKYEGTIADRLTG